MPCVVCCRISHVGESEMSERQSHFMGPLLSVRQGCGQPHTCWPLAGGCRCALAKAAARPAWRAGSSCPQPPKLAPAPRLCLCAPRPGQPLGTPTDAFVMSTQRAALCSLVCLWHLRVTSACDLTLGPRALSHPTPQSRWCVNAGLCSVCGVSRLLLFSLHFVCRGCAAQLLFVCV